MDTLLDELYFKFGKRDPKKYNAINAEIIEKCENELKIMLNATQWSRLIELIDAYDEMLLIMSMENFKCGAVLGARLINELTFETEDCENQDFN